MIRNIILSLAAAGLLSASAQAQNDIVKRYGADTPTVFYKTAITGREPKGMPSWKDVLEDESLWKICTFLKTVQQ